VKVNSSRTENLTFNLSSGCESKITRN